MSQYLQLNSIQHYMFCKRRWALINIEQVWEDNADTRLGQYIHKNADDPFFEEKRQNRIIIRSVPISSDILGLNGIIDVLELTKSKDGVFIKNYPGLWKPYVIEYKKGTYKNADFDIYQLVAEVMCIEEMLNTKINKSSIYYKTSNKRFEIEITDKLRNDVIKACNDMHELFEKGITPKAEDNKNCTRCSMYEKCMPRITNRKRSVINYINKHLEELI